MIKKLCQRVFFGSDRDQAKLNRLYSDSCTVLKTEPLREYRKQSVCVARASCATNAIESILSKVENKPPRRRALSAREINEICVECGYERGK